MGDSKYLTLAVDIGEELLRNGAEIYRVEDSIAHVLKAYKVDNYNVYVLANGIFINQKFTLKAFITDIILVTKIAMHPYSIEMLIT